MKKEIIFTLALSVLCLLCTKKTLKSHSMIGQGQTIQAIERADDSPRPAKVVPLVIQTPIIQRDLPILYFDFDKSDIRADAEMALRGIDIGKGGSLVVSGHADERGTIEYNQRLGMRRAQAVKRWLIEAGITIPIWCVSYGKTKPVRFGCTDEDCHQLNRRAEIVIK